MNENRVFDTNDPQLDLAPLCHHPAAGQSAELWACQRQNLNASCIDIPCYVFTPDAKQILLERESKRGQKEI